MGPQPRREEPVHRRWQYLRHLGGCEPDANDPGARAVCRGRYQAASGHPVRLTSGWNEMTMRNSPSASGSHALSADQCRSFLCLAEMIIPASAEYGVPSAGDDMILADILRSLGRDAGHVVAVLQTLDTLSGGVFADLDAPRRGEVAARLRAAGGDALMYLTRIVLQCYYRDDRVMCSLDMEVRPPFPKGFEVEQGDWSLLDPVRARPKLFRDVP